MNKVWTETHWRGLAVAIVAVGVVAAARAGGEDNSCAPSLAQAQTSLRDLPSGATSPGNLAQADLAQASIVAQAPPLAKAAATGNLAESSAACAAQSPGDWNRDAQRALAATVTMTTTNVIDRNPAHAVTLAFARP